MKLMIDVPFSGDAFAQLADKLQRAIRFGLARAAMRIRSEVRASDKLIPVDTGYLRSTFTTGVIENRIELRWGAKYAEVVEIGADPHTIKAKAAPFLVFRDSRTGKWVRKKEVEHKGYPGRFYKFKVGAFAMQIMNEEIAAAIARVRMSAA